MAAKKKAETPGDPAPAKRKAITMETKLDIVKRSEKGETPTNIGKALGFSRSTVATIIKDKTRILDHVKGSAPMKATVISKQRSSILIKTEKLLMIWIEYQNQRRLPLSQKLIQEKARRIFKILKEQKGKEAEKEEFTASKGWFMRFKARACLHNLKLQGEAASADETTPRAYPDDLNKIIREGGYLAEQVFNVDETGVLSKRLPIRTYVSKEKKTAPGHKVGKDKLTLLLGGNAAEELSFEDLVELEKQMIEEEESLETPEPRHFTTRGLDEAFSLLEQAMARFEAEDPNMERFSKALKGVMDSVQCYLEIWEEKRKIYSHTDTAKYFTKVQKPVEAIPSTSTQDPAPVTPLDDPDSPRAEAFKASPPFSATSQQ